MHGDRLAFYADFADAAGEAHAAVADWGDGSPPELLALDEPGAFAAVNGSDLGTAYGLHSYANSGLRTVTLTVYDAAGHAASQQFTALVGQGRGEPSVGPSASFGADMIAAGSDGGALSSDEPTAPASADSSGPDVTPPAVRAAYVGSSRPWAADFLNYLQANGLGSAGYGFAAPAGAGQLAPLPWTNLDRVSIRFTEDVSVQADDLALYGVGTDTYAFADPARTFAYDPATFTATWALAAPLPADRLLLDLDGNTADGVTDRAGNLLDGDWSNANAAESFPGGDGPAGGDFEFRLDVLPGDADRSGAADAGDLVKVRNRGGTSPASPGTDPNTYSAFYDVDGSGAIDAADLVLARKRSGTSLPAGTTPGAPAAPTGLWVGQFSATELGLSWSDDSDREDGYSVERSPDGVNNWSIVATLGPDQSGFLDAGLSPDTTYYYRVRAVNAGMYSAYSDVADNRTTPTAPDAPSGLVATTVSESQIDLSWADNSADEDEFVVMRARELDAGTWEDYVEAGRVGAGVTQFHDTGLDQGGTYRYYVYPVNAGGYPTYGSAVATGGTFNVTPQDFRVTGVHPWAIDLAWSDTSDGEAYYELEYSVGGWVTSSTLLPANTTEYSMTFATHTTDQAYSFRIRPVHARGVAERVLCQRVGHQARLGQSVPADGHDQRGHHVHGG